MLDAWKGREITMGDNVRMGSFTIIRSADHKYTDKSKLIKEQGYVGGQKIGKDIWIGSHVVILKDTIIGDHSIITAQA